MSEGYLVPLATLLRRSPSSDDEGDDETEAILADVVADHRRLRELLDEEEEEETPPPVEAVEAPSLGDLLAMCGPSEALAPGPAPTLDELLRLCGDDEERIIEQLTGFVCPECLMVAPSQEGLHEHYAAAHAHLWASWKRAAGRKEGGEGYALGDGARCVARKLRVASWRTKRRLVRHLRQAQPRREGWLAVATGVAGVAVGVLGAPVAGAAIAIAGFAARPARRRIDKSCST